MSRIYFTSPSGEAELRGSERAHMGIMCSDFFLVSLGLSYPDYEREKLFLKLIPKNSYMHGEPPNRFGSSLRRWLHVGSDARLIVDGKHLDTFCLGLNSAYMMGSDPVKLMARLHGQCEIHCYVEGPNRKWLASVMREGRETGICRSNEGWEGVIEFLETRDDEPVVCSYSVCESFPHFGCLPSDHPLRQPREDEDEDEDRFEKFHELSDDEQWALCLRGLREMDGLEIKPENWNTFRFGHSKTGFDIVDALQKVEI